MPEGDTIYRTARAMGRALIGKPLFQYTPVDAGVGAIGEDGHRVYDAEEPASLVPHLADDAPGAAIVKGRMPCSSLLVSPSLFALL